MPAPTPTYNQFAFDNLLKPTPDVLPQPLMTGSVNFQAPVSGHGNIDFPYSYTNKRKPDDPMADGVRKLFNSGPSEKFMSSPVTYNADEINAARYVTSPDYLKLGISLNGDNEEAYGQNQSWSEVLSNGVKGMGKLAANGFVDGWKQWGRTTDALIHWDWDRLHGDAQSMLESDATLKEIMNSNPIYATKEGTDSFWNRQTFGNFLQQSGFAVGAGVQMLSEQIITKAIEAGLTLTGVGAGGAAGLELATDVKTAATIGRVAGFFNKSKEFFNAAKAVKNLKKLGDVWKDENLIKNFVTGIGERIPGVDIAMDISKTYRTGVQAGLSGGKLAGDIAKVGLGGLKRTMSEANFAFTEARMEAAGTFSDLYSQMQDDHFKRTGRFAENDDLQTMQNTAMKAADKNFNFNSAVLAVSNRIMFDNVFKNSKITSKILSQFGEDVGEKGFKVLGKINGRSTSQYYTGGVLKNYKTIAADFGTRKARTVLAKSIMKPALQFEATEGLQELLQEGSAEYYKDYYLNSYKATYNPDIKPNSKESLDKAISSQMNMQGLKTFASGALTGMLLHGPTVLVSKGGKKLGETIKDTYKTKDFSKEDKEKYFQQKKESENELQNYYNEFNVIAKDPSKFFSESIKNFNVQKEGVSALDEAAKLGDKFGYENIRTDMLHSMVSQAVRNDTHEALADTLREYGKHMSKEEFEQAFVGLDYTSENKMSTADYTEKVANSVESYAKTYNKLQEKYGSRVNPNRYGFGTKEYQKELSKKQVLNNMIDVLAGNEFKSTDAISRSLDLYTKATSHKSLGSSLASAYNILGSEINLKKEMSVLNLEIETKKQQLESEGITIENKNELKKEIELKEKQKKSLQEWSETKDELIDERKVTKSYDAFKSYLELKNLEFGKTSSVNVNEVEDLFVDFNDYLKLNKKSQNHVDAINMLSNPKYFDEVYTRMAVGSQLAYHQLLQDAAMEEIKAGLAEPNKHFIVEVNGSFGVSTPGGEVLTVVDTIEEAREIKKTLDSAIFSEDELEEFIKNNEVPESEETGTKKTEEKPAESKEKKEVKLLINGKVATIISEEIDKKDNLKIFEYVFDDDAEKEIYQFKFIDGKPIDTETGELITVSAVETKEKLGDKSIDEQIAELEAKIKALPDGGMVTTDGGMTPSEELKNLNDKIKALKAQKESEEEVTTTSDIEAKKADIERRRQEELLLIDEKNYLKKGAVVTGIINGDAVMFKDNNLFILGGTATINGIPNLKGVSNISSTKEIKDAVNAKYDAELTALEKQPTSNQSDIVIVYHHTKVNPKDFNFGNFQRGKEQISQFGDGLNASTTTTPFFVKRYGNPIKGEVKDSDFIVIDTNKSEKELYEELKSKGYKFNNPDRGSYIENNPNKEYDNNEKANENPAIISLFNDFQKSNPEIKGVKIINHIIGTEKVDPFYVIYDAKSFYGPESLIKTSITEKEIEEEDDVINDIEQILDDKKKTIIDTDSTEVDKIFQDGMKQTAPALSLANRTHAVNVVEIEPGKERFERGDVNNTYVFDVATPTFMPGKSVTFKVDEFDGTNYDDANIGIYSIIEGKEVRIGAVHTPQWIAEQKGSNKAYTHIVIPESEKYDAYPKTLLKEVGANKKLRKLILDNYKNNSNFVLNGTVNDKSIGIIVTMNAQGTLAERLNPEIGKGGLENRHGMFGIIRGGFIRITKNHKIDINKIVPVKSFNADNISQYEGYSIMLIPTPTGQFFPTFIKLPNVAREQSEFILKAWKAFTNKETNFELVKQVYKAAGAEYLVGNTIDIEVLKSYIDHYITNLNSKPLSQTGNGVDVSNNTARIDIFADGNIKFQSKLNEEWKTFTIKDEKDIPDNILDHMDNLITTIRFNNAKNNSLRGINSTNKITMFSVKNNVLSSKEMNYNQYIMEGAKTYLEKGIESKNENNDWVYFANPVVKFQYNEPLSKDSFEDIVENKETDVTLAEVNISEKEEDLGALLLAALKAEELVNESVEEQKKNCAADTSLADELNQFI